jgi:hypothetical protein
MNYFDIRNLTLALEQATLFLQQITVDKTQLQDKASKLFNFNLIILSGISGFILHFLIPLSAYLYIFLIIIFAIYIIFIFFPISKAIEPGIENAAIGKAPYFFGEKNRLIDEHSEVMFELLQDAEHRIETQLTINREIEKYVKRSHRSTFFINIILIFTLFSILYFFSKIK